jgi:hypothetical protein
MTAYARSTAALGGIALALVLTACGAGGSSHPAHDAGSPESSPDNRTAPQTTELDPCTLLIQGEYAPFRSAATAKRPFRLERGLSGNDPAIYDCTARVGETGYITVGYSLPGFDFDAGMQGVTRRIADLRRSSKEKDLRKLKDILRVSGLTHDGPISGVGDRAYLTGSIDGLSGYAEKDGQAVMVDTYNGQNVALVKQLLTTLLTRVGPAMRVSPIRVPSSSGCAAPTSSLVTSLLGTVAYARASRYRGLPHCSYADAGGHLVQLQGERYPDQAAFRAQLRFAKDVYTKHVTRLTGPAGASALVDKDSASLSFPKGRVTTFVTFGDATDRKVTPLPLTAKVAFVRDLLRSPPPA